MTHFLERHSDKILGVISCCDRVISQGTLPDICHPNAITTFFYAHGKRIFDLKQWAAPLRDQIRDNIEALAADHGLQIEFIRKQQDFRKEQRIKELLAQRGDHPGIVHIFSALESCTAFKPWHDGSGGIIMYDKFACLLRIEIFTNDVSFFKHHRRVEHRDGTYSYQTANMRKTIYSLPDLAELMQACNARYLNFLSAVDDPTVAIQKVGKISRAAKQAGRSYRGFNLFDAHDEAVFQAAARGESQGFGIRNSTLRSLLGKTSGQTSRILKRLRN